MKRMRIIAFLLCLAMIISLSACTGNTTPSSAPAPADSGASQSSGEAPVKIDYPQFLSIGGGTPGGSYFPVAAGFAQLFSTKTPMKANAQSTTGGGQNIQLMGAGEIEMGIADNMIIKEAYNGENTFAQAPNKDIRAICTIYPNYFQQLVRLDSGINSMADIGGKRMIVGGPSSGTENITRKVYAAHGFDYTTRKDLIPEYLGTAAGQEKIQNRQANGLSFINFFPYSAINEMTMVGDGKLISLEDDAIKELCEGNSPYQPGTIPAGTYKDQTEDIKTIFMQTVLIADASMPDDLVYAMTKMIYENLDYLKAQNNAFTYMDINTAAQGITIPLHPGAERYYKEVGVLK